MSFELDFGVIFDDYIAANQKTWAHDRSSTLGASEAFDCNRKNFYEKRGKEIGAVKDPDTQNWGAMERGNIIENHYVVPALTNHLPDGVELLFAGQDTQETLVTGRNSATPDGLFVGIPKGPVTIKYRDGEIVLDDVQEGCIGLEIKSIDPRAILAEERAKHRGQSQIALGIIREVTEYKPRYWIILYVDASFLDKVRPFVVEYDEDVWESAKMRAAEVWAAKDPMDLMPEGKFDGGCQYCRWTNACGDSIMKTFNATKPGALDNPFLVEQIETIVTDFAEARGNLARAEEEMERKKHLLQEFLATQGLNKVATEKFSVTWYKQKGKETVDVKALAAAGIDLTPYKKTGQPFTQLRVTERSTKNVD
jgi:hypothetical protein